MQSMKPSALPTSEASYGTGPSRSGRALRLVPLLGLLAGAFIGYAALFGAGDAAGGPSELKLDIGKPFVQGILALLKMKVDQVTLNKPPSRWAQSALGIISFDLVMDLHMEMLFFGAQVRGPRQPRLLRLARVRQCATRRGACFVRRPPNPVSPALRRRSGLPR